MKLQQFNGGLATRLRPQFLQQNEAVEYLNIDNSTGALTPVKDKLATNIPSNAYNWYSSALARWFSSTVYTSYAELDNKVYTTTGDSIPQVYEAGIQYNMGITAPGPLILAASLPSSVVTDVTLSSANSGSAAALPNQDISYLFINDSAGIYSLTFEVLMTASVIPKTKSYLRGRYGAASDTPSLPVNSKQPGRVFTAAGDLTKKVITISLARTAVFGSNGVKVFRQYKGTWHRVGILVDATASILDATEDISLNEVLDITKHSPLQGVYQYVMTYYDNTRGRESGPSVTSAEFDLSDSGVLNFSSIPVSSDATVTHKRIYRVGGDITNFSLVAQIPNAQTTFTDNVKDLDIGDLLTTQIYLPAPSTLKYICTSNGMLFGADGAKVRFTPIGKPEAWPELYYITFESTITSIAVVYTGILVCTLTKTYVITGSGPNSLSVSSAISTDQGCLSHTSMQVLKGAALWVSYEGICASSGDTVKVISRQQLGKLNITPVDSVLINEVYHVLDASGITYSFDTAIGPIFKKFNFGVTSLAKKDSSLYGYKSGVLYELQKASTNLSFTYLSPKFIEGSFTKAKVYKHIYIYSKGDIIVKVYIKDILVATKVLDTEDNHTISVPQDLQRGYFIQFEISGTGEVFEIEYIAEAVKN